MKPDYAKASVALKDEKVTLAAIDCTEHGGVCSKHGANGYPTVLWFEDADVAEGEKYEGARNEDGIVDWIKKQLSGEGKDDDDEEEEDDDDDEEEEKKGEAEDLGNDEL